jgi:methyl-accepting chemotaxis protein
MINSSSLSKALAATFISVAALILAAAFAVLDWHQAEAIAAKAGLAGASLGVYFLWRTRQIIHQATDISRKVAKGDFEARIIGITENGDLGTMLNSLNRMIDCCDAFVRESANSMGAIRSNKYYRQIREEGLHGALKSAARTMNEAMEAIAMRVGAFETETGKFEASIRVIVNSVARASDQMGGAAGTLSTGAGLTTERANSVAAATEQATANMQTIAAACTELTTSAKDVGDKVGQCAMLTREAVAKAGDASKKIAVLSEASGRIGEMATLISSIARQTNLLALNATIEAARAGEAGKGFAVVASEVKALAEQTAKASGQIADYIESIQGTTRTVMDAIADVGSIIGDVDHTAADVAETARAQSAATGEIAQNVEQAFIGFREISSNIHGVTMNIDETGQVVVSAQATSCALSMQARQLDSEVRGFMLALRRGPMDRRSGEDARYEGPERRKSDAA